MDSAYFGMDDQLYDSKPVSGIHGDSDDTEDDQCIGGMHGEFREKEWNDDT